MKKALAAILILGFLIFGAAAAGCSQKKGDKQSTPQGAVDVFITAFQQRNLEALREIFADGGLSSEDQEFLSTLFTVVDIKSYQVEEIVRFSEDVAEVKVNLTMVIYNREKTGQNVFRVIKKDGRWYLSNQLQ